MSLLQQFIAGTLVLSALYLILKNPPGVLSAAQAGRNLIGGTQTDIITGGQK